MSSDGSITLTWGDGEHDFRFAIGQFRELQEKVNQRRLAIGGPMIGPMALLKALEASDAWPDDVRDVIRIGLNGKGMKPADSNRLMATYFDNTPPLEHMRTAFVVLFAGLAGAPGDEVTSKKKKTRRMKTGAPRSSSQNSTEPALQ